MTNRFSPLRLWCRSDPAADKPFWHPVASLRLPRNRSSGTKRSHFRNVSVRALDRFRSDIRLLCAGLMGRCAREQSKAVSEIRSTGGSVRYDWQSFSQLGHQEHPWAPPWLIGFLGIDFIGTVRGVQCAGSDRAIASLHHLTGLEELHLFESTTDDSLQKLAGLANLRELSVEDGSLVTNAGLVSLARLPKLEVIRFEGFKVTDDGLASLTRISGLRSLNLSGHPVTDDGLRSVSRLIKLEWLALANTAITDAGLRCVDKLKSLKHLDLTNTDIKGAGLSHLRGLDALETLILDGTLIGDDQIQLLSGLRSLRDLQLNYCELSDKCLVHFRELKELRRVSFNGTRIRGYGLSDLQGLPNLGSISLVTEVAAEECVANVALLTRLKELVIERRAFNDSQIGRLRDALAPDVKIILH